MAYTPGVARVCQAIADDPDKAWALTIKGNTVAVVTDGTAVLGLGDIGPQRGDAGDGGQGDAVQGVRRRRRVPALPRHEGRRRDRRVRQGGRARRSAASTSRTSRRRAASRSSGGCSDELDIPVFHDDQHGTAIVVLAALLNALRVVGKRAEDIRVVVVGAGAAGVACSEIILAHGVARPDRLRHRRRALPGPRRAGPDARRARRAHEPRRPPRHRRRACSPAPT